MKIGEINKLQVLREAPQGLYLGDTEGNDVLLPNKYVPADTVIDSFVEVFLYTDSEDRIIATTLIPAVKLNEIGVLRVREVNDIGAFMEWNIEKDILVPYSKQKGTMQRGHYYPVYLYLDETTNRLVATTKIGKYLNNDVLTIAAGDEVEIIFYEHTTLGYKVIINKIHHGLVYHDELFEKVEVGNIRKGYIKTIRPDNKIDVSLNKLGFANIDSFTTKITDYLKKNNGKIMLTDNSSPDEIKNKLGMSKKQFKKSVGVLYKAKQVLLEADGIRLV